MRVHLQREIAGLKKDILTIGAMAELSVREAAWAVERRDEALARSVIEKDIKIWGDPKYFDVIMDTIQECIKVSQRLLTLSLIAPTLFSLILLLFYYNIPLIP